MLKQERALPKRLPLCWKNGYAKTFVAPKCAKSGELPQVMALESTSVGAEDYKFENETDLFSLNL